MYKDLIPNSANIGIIAIDENLNILKYDDGAKEFIPNISIGDNFLNYVEDDSLKKELEDLISGKVDDLNKLTNLKNSKSTAIYAFSANGITFIQIMGTQKQEEGALALKQYNTLQLIYDFVLNTAKLQSLEDFFMATYQNLKKILNFNSFAISLVNKDKKSFTVVFSYEEGKKLPQRAYTLNPKGSLTGWVIYNKKMLYIKDVRKEKLPSKTHQVGHTISSWLGIPLIHKNEVLGALVICGFEPEAFKEDDVKLLRTLATYISLILKNVILYEKIRENKDMLENLVNTTLVGIVIEGMDGKLSFVNDAFAKMLGYSSGELIGKRIVSFATPKSREIMIKKGELREKGISDSYEAQFVKSNGEILDVLINASPLKDENGKLIGIVGVISDITERKNIERKLKEEWEKYKTMLENLLVGVVIVQDAKVIFANNVIAELLKYKREEAIGENFLKFVHPDMRDYLWETYQRRLKGLPVPSSYIVKFMDSQGNGVWTIIRSSIVDWEGKRAVMVSIQDITRIKNMEEKLLALVKIFEKIKLAHTKEEIYDLAINALTSILNLKIIVIAEILGDKITAKKWKGIKHPKSLALSSENSIVTWVARNNKSYYAPDVSKEPLYLKVNPETRSEYATPISSNHKLFGVLNVESDELDGISDDDRMLIDLVASHMAVALVSLEYHKELEEAKNLQELMLHIVSHDLKNPLAVLHGYLELMNEGRPNEYIPTMMNALQEAEDIIEKARLFSKLGNKNIDMKKEEIDLKELIESTIKLIQQKYPQGNIIENVSSFHIQALPILKEVFVNILDNAFKYGASKVIVESNIFEKNVEIRIADDGPGIPEDKRDIIFKPFERLASDKGSGLGLAIVKRIMELHNGEVRIENNVPKGTVFVLRFPIN